MYYVFINAFQQLCINGCRIISKHFYNMLHLFVLLVILSNFHIFECLQCVDENNKNVDWYIIYKMPKLKGKGQLFHLGAAYAYLTSENYNNWIMSQNSINDSNSILGRTLEPFYANTSLSYVLYNDQPPNENPQHSKGHTKGVILADLNGGFWLIHSAPHFPPLSPTYQFSKSAFEHGQSFLCISFDLANLNQVGVQLQYNEAQIYTSFISDKIQGRLEKIVEAVAGMVVINPPWYHKILLKSQGGQSFISFAKSGKFGKELYADWVAPELETDLYVESWLNGPGQLPSDCSKPFKVFNVDKLTLNNASFVHTQDHSKWAISAILPWLCIGDINRMAHQKVRGGGTVCLKNKQLAANYQRMVDSIEKCDN